MSHSDEKKRNQPSWVHPTVRMYAPARKRARDLMEGQDALQDKDVVQLYLPKLPREELKYYNVRVADSPLTNFFRSIVKGGRALMFSRPPMLDPSAGDFWKRWWDDVTSDGTNGVTFFKSVGEEMLLGGYGVVLVDYPMVDPGMSVGEIERQKIRPYLSLYDADHVTNFRLTADGGKTVISMLVLREDVLVSDGSKFGMVKRCQYRVFRRIVSERLPEPVVVSQLYTPNPEDEEEWVAGPMRRVFNQTEIPAVEFSIDPEAGFAGARPALLDVVDLNLAHYRTTSHRRWAQLMAAFPMPVRIGYRPPDGEEGGEEPVGSGFVMDLPAVPGADFKWAAPPEAAFTPTEKEILKLEAQIGQIGFGFLTGETRYQYDETATAKELNQRRHDATLADCSKNLEDGMNEVGYFVSRYQGLPYDETKRLFTMSAEFQKLGFDAAMITALSQMEANDQLSLETLLESIKLGRLPDNFDVQEEVKRILEAVEQKMSMMPPVVIQSAPQLGPDGKPVEQEPTQEQAFVAAEG